MLRPMRATIDLVPEPWLDVTPPEKANAVLAAAREELARFLHLHLYTFDVRSNYINSEAAWIVKAYKRGLYTLT